MKFEYENKERDDECVAFIHRSGAFIYKTSEGCFVFDDEDGGGHTDTELWWNQWKSHSIHKFYPGDKITITF